MNQFLIALALVLLASMLIVGSWINKLATVRILDQSAEIASQYLESLLQPHVQSLENDNYLSAADIDALQGIAESFPVGGQFLALQVWNKDGTLLFESNSPLLSVHPDDDTHEGLEKDFLAAKNGGVVGVLSNMPSDSRQTQRDTGFRLYEIYAPLRNLDTGAVIAVAEIYQDADYVSGGLIASAKDNWTVFAVAGILMFLALSLIVARGSRTIERQQRNLEDRITQQEELMSRNEVLRARITKAMFSAARIDEMAQQRLGADLHDGAAQLVGFVSLRLARLARLVRAGGIDDYAQADELLEDLRDATEQASEELRTVSAGLMSAHLKDAHSLPDILNAIAKEHERKTGTPVSIIYCAGPLALSESVIRTIGRIVLEALTNCYKHAGGKGQMVSVRIVGDDVLVSISDEGPGMAGVGLDETTPSPAKLGLRGMKFRAESLGGELRIRSRDPHGTIVECSIPVG